MRAFKGYMRGINLGGWFSQCDHSEKRYDYFVRRDDFSRIARWGFDHVRIPVDYELILNSDMSFRESGFRRLENCILWCRDNGLNMILDLHKTPGFSFDDGENENGFFAVEKYQQIFYAIWKEFAVRFGGNSHLSFELLNEVSDRSFSEKWNEIVKKTITVIRTSSPEIPVIVGGYHNNSVRAIKDLDLPFDRNIVYTFHCYSPLVFTHQGAYWLSGMNTSFRTNLLHTYREYEELTMQQVGSGSAELFPGEDAVFSAEYFEWLFKEALTVAEERDVSLYCGEYGVIDLADSGETLRWYELIHSVFEKHHIGRAMWSYKEMDFGLVDAHYDPIRKQLLKVR